MSDAAEELYSLLIPLGGDRLIVPRACVAEVVRFTRPEVRDGSNPWLLGTVSWTGRDLPVVSFEGVIGKEQPDNGGRTRIVVFHATTNVIPAGCFGILTQGSPQLVRVNREVLRLDQNDDDSWEDTAPILCRVKMINEYPLVPDLEHLERLIGDGLTQA